VGGCTVYGRRPAAGLSARPDSGRRGGVYNAPLFAGPGSIRVRP
jgi:hypothetical protein